MLVGTASIESSERLSALLKKKRIKHSVLNAKMHEKEAEIIAQAGQMGAVTISTNMAGRGTDIVLGDGVTDLGGLHILGTERHGTVGRMSGHHFIDRVINGFVNQVVQTVRARIANVHSGTSTNMIDVAHV